MVVKSFLKLLAVLVLTWLIAVGLWWAIAFIVGPMDHEAHKIGEAVGSLATLLICTATLIFVIAFLVKSRLPWLAAIVALLVSLTSIIFQWLVMTVAYWA